MCGARGIREISVLSAQLCCEMKTDQKRKKNEVLKIMQALESLKFN